MTLSTEAAKIHQSITAPNTKLGEIKQLAKEIKQNHNLAMELWSSGDLNARLLATLIMDKKQIDQTLIDSLIADLQAHTFTERNQLMEWLMANQLMKDKKCVSLILSWEEHPTPLLRRTFWYYQARLRWMGKNPENNTELLLAAIEKKLADEKPEVQWAMNYTAAWIGVYEKSYRKRCIHLGEKLGLYKGDMVSKGCTPDYLPEFIAIESAKRGL